MAPKMRLTAFEFESKYGDLVRVDYAEYKTAYTLRKALDSFCQDLNSIGQSLTVFDSIGQDVRVFDRM